MEPTTLTRVTYQAERVGWRGILGSPVGRELAELQDALDEIARFVLRAKGVLVKDSVDFEIEERISMKVYPVTLGLVTAWQWEPVRVDVMNVTAWAWRDVRPEHRDKLEGVQVRRPSDPVDLISLV